MRAEKIAEKAEAITELAELLPRGSTIYLIARSKSARGRRNIVDVHCVVGGRLVWIAPLVAKAVGLELVVASGKQGVVLKGSGFDLGSALAAEISIVLGYTTNGRPHGIDKHWV